MKVATSKAHLVSRFQQVGKVRKAELVMIDVLLMLHWDHLVVVQTKPYLLNLSVTVLIA